MTESFVLPTVFVSYSHEDEAWKDCLVTHLAGLEQAGRLRVWNDSLIGIGQSWLQEIEAAMEAARVAVLLVSPEFLASKFIQTREVPRLLELRAEKGIHVVPVLVRDCVWGKTLISSLQVRPRYGRALELFSEPEQNTALKEIAEEILELLCSEAPPLPPVQKKSRRKTVTVPVIGGCVLLAAAVASLVWQESLREEVRDHLSRAAGHLGLRDICLYSEPSYRDTARARDEITSARESMNWVLWGRDDLEVRVYQFEAEAWLFDKKYKQALLSIKRGSAINDRFLGLIIDQAAVLKDQMVFLQDQAKLLRDPAESLKIQGAVREVQEKLRAAEAKLSRAYQRAERETLDRELDEALACAAVNLALVRADLPEKANSAGPLFEEAVRRYPDRFITQYAYGQYLYGQNKMEESLEYVKRAVRIDPEDVLALLQLAEIHFNIAESGRATLVHYRDARRFYENGFQLASLSPEILLNEAQMYVNFGKTLFHLGEIQAAREALERGLLGVTYSTGHEIWLGNSFLLLSQVHACLGLWVPLENSLEQGRQYNPELATYLERFRKDRQSDPAKWQPWGCQASLTLQEQAPG